MQWLIKNGETAKPGHAAKAGDLVEHFGDTFNFLPLQED